MEILTAMAATGTARRKSPPLVPVPEPAAPPSGAPDGLLQAEMDQWMARYADEPVLWVRECLGADPDPWQVKVLRAYQRAISPQATDRDRRISIRSGHGPGKTALLAWIAIHFILFRFPQKTAATAPTESQMYDALFSEIRTWITRLPEPIQKLLDVKSDRIELVSARSESFFSAKTARPEKPEALAGVHSEWVLLIADEASGIHELIFEAASGSMSGHNAITILAGNPVRSTGLFFDTHHKLKERWTTFVVSCYDSPRIALSFIEDMKARYGELSNAFRVRVLGEFPIGDADTIIPRDWIEAAAGREVEPATKTVVWGLDVAYMGDDRSALVKRNGNVVPERPQWKRGLETMQVVGWVKGEWDKTASVDRPTEICVDSIGYGAGVADRLRELGLPIRAVNVSESPALGGNYPNLRTELWYEGRAWFAARDCRLPAYVAGGGDEVMEDFVEELAAQTYEPPSSTGKTMATPKKIVKKKLGRSPDFADAFMLTFASNAFTALFGRAGRPGEALKRNIKGFA